MFRFSTGPFVTYVRYQICENNILKMNEPILMQICISGPRSKGTKRPTSGPETKK